MKRVLIISLLLLLATFFYRLPALVNSEEINSDGAIVGLQAMHMLHGEWSWTLWGANYQSSIDSAMTAIAFAIFGVSPLVLMLVPVFGHLIVTFLALRVIARRSNLMVAAIAVLPLVITPWAVSSVVTIPPRQWCITIVFIAVWLLDGASESKRPMLRYALGGLMAPLAIFADVYAILFVPGLAAFGLMCLLDGKPDRRLLIRRTLACGAGGLIAAIIVFVGRLSHPGTVPLPTLTLDRIAINADLFWNWCLPFALGYKLVPHEFHAQFVLNRLAMPWYALQIFGGWSLIVGIVLGGTFLVRKMPWKLSRLGLFG
ncbi:MAG TPA: hypothetical protein VHD56_19280, partial [Tepidisphaeraceae bacterium]|nr:hypothetical protein [Tepidisphaeraceae bacterium]